MIAYQSLNRAPVEDPRRRDRFRRHRLQQQSPQHAPEPVVSRYVESRLLPRQHRLRQLAAHQFPQHVLLRSPANLQPFRQRCREFHDPVIQERWTNLQRMRHAHPVRLVQNIVRQIVTLIHPQIPVQHAPWRHPELVNQSPQPAPIRPRPDLRQLLRRKSNPLPFVPGRICASCSGENVPFQKKCASSGSSRLPSSQRFSLYSRLILSSDTGMYRSKAPRISRRSPTGAMRRNGLSSRSAWYVRYPPNNSSAPSPESATVTCRRLMRERNHTGSAPAFALGSSE